MASGFIKITDKDIFSTRWTGFDEILKLIIQELIEINNSKELIALLKTHIPPENYDEDELEMGWGFIDENTNKITSRLLELKEISKKDLQLFWNAASKVNDKIDEFGCEYSSINPTLIKELLMLNINLE